MIQTLVCLLLQIALIVMFARAILSWFPLAPGSAMASVYDFLGTITEPVLRPIRQVIPPLTTGGLGIDLSFIVVVLGIYILRMAIC